MSLTLRGASPSPQLQAERPLGASALETKQSCWPAGLLRERGCMSVLRVTVGRCPVSGPHVKCRQLPGKHHAGISPLLGVIICYPGLKHWRVQSPGNYETCASKSSFSFVPLRFSAQESTTPDESATSSLIHLTYSLIINWEHSFNSSTLI